MNLSFQPVYNDDDNGGVGGGGDVVMSSPAKKLAISKEKRFDDPMKLNMNSSISPMVLCGEV